MPRDDERSSPPVVPSARKPVRTRVFFCAASPRLFQESGKKRKGGYRENVVFLMMGNLMGGGLTSSLSRVR